MKQPVLLHLSFFILFANAALICTGQETAKNNKKDTIISKAALGEFKQTIYALQEKVQLQQYELRVLKETRKVDSLLFGKDSLVVLFTEHSGKPLLRITQKSKGELNNFNDSIVIYYNRSGLMEYSELWRTEGGKAPCKMKLTCRRYEYDDQNRVIRYVVNYPTPASLEYIFTYDAVGNAKREERKIDLWEFWEKLYRRAKHNGQ